MAAYDLYAAMDWLLDRQPKVEDTLAARHLSEGTLVLYDVSSAALEGKCCPPAKVGYARDGVKGRPQVVTNKQGLPVAVEAFEGNTGDSTPSPTRSRRSSYVSDSAMWCWWAIGAC